MQRVFISYRREDSNNIAGRIFDRLVTEFGRKNVFKDVDSIPIGSDFRKVLSDAVSRCDIFLSIIGNDWLEASDHAGKRRLDAKTDFVRVEIEAAFERGVTVVPILVDGALMPAPDDLPSTLQDLSYRNAICVRHDPDFHHDMDRLIAGLTQSQVSNLTPRATTTTTTTTTPKRKSPALFAAALLGVLACVGLLVSANSSLKLSWFGEIAKTPKPQPDEAKLGTPTPDPNKGRFPVAPPSTGKSEPFPGPFVPIDDLPQPPVADPAFTKENPNNTYIKGGPPAPLKGPRLPPPISPSVGQFPPQR